MQRGLIGIFEAFPESFFYLGRDLEKDIWKVIQKKKIGRKKEYLGRFVEK